jgi:hypothetical protein
MEKSENSTKPRHVIVRFLSHPLTGFAVGIIGIVLAIYFYCAGDKKPKLMFLIHPIRTPIVQAGKLSDVSVSLRGKPINGDLRRAFVQSHTRRKSPSLINALKS